jgi:polysaccharide biosynthesis transport protein
MKMAKKIQSLDQEGNGEQFTDSALDPSMDVFAPDYLEVLRRRWWILLLVGSVITVAGTYYTATRPKVYEASAKLIVAGKSQGGAGSEILGNLSALTSNVNVETQLEVLNSPGLLDDAYESLMEPGTRERMEKVRRAFLSKQTLPGWASRFENRKDTDVVTVFASSYDPDLAAELANKIMATYFARDKVKNSENIEKARDFVRKQIGVTNIQLMKASKDLADYKIQTGLVASISQIPQGAGEVATLRSQLAADQVSLREEVRRRAVLGKQAKETSPEIPGLRTIQENPEFAAVRQDLATLQLKLAQQLQEYTPSSIEVQQTRGQIKAEEQHLATVARTILGLVQVQRNPVVDLILSAYATNLSQIAILEERVKGTESILRRLDAEVSTYPLKERKLAGLQLKVDYLTRVYGNLYDRFYGLNIELESALPGGYVVSRARSPKAPTSPNVPRGFMTFLLIGLLVGGAVSLVIDRMDTRIHEPSQVESISGLTPVGAIPESVAMDQALGGRLFIGGVKHNHAFLESFRLLRHNIAFSSPDRELKLIAVTSAGEAEGKSTVSVNLAIAFAMDGKNVLLVDCDLRRPAIHKWMGIDKEVGFTAVARGQKTLQEAAVVTRFEGVSCLPSGPLPPNPTEFLNSQHSRDLLRLAATLYDVVIVDCPPCTGMSDVQVISTMVDGVLPVVALDSTKKHFLHLTTRMLRQAGAPLIGVVLNHVQNRRNTYGYYSYYYYYSEETGDREKSKRRRSTDDGKGPSA